MSKVLALMAATALGLGSAAQRGAAQVPSDLRAAILARDSAIARVDAAVWDRLTAGSFTAVLEDGTFMTKSVRLAQFRRQAPSAFTPVQGEKLTRAGTAWIRRFFDNGTWVIEVWGRTGSTWQAVAVQVTTGHL